MTKQEALDKIEELRKYIDDIDYKIIAPGQVYVNKEGNGDTIIVVGVFKDYPSSLDERISYIKDNKFDLENFHADTSSKDTFLSEYRLSNIQGMRRAYFKKLLNKMIGRIEIDEDYED